MCFIIPKNPPDFELLNGMVEIFRGYSWTFEIVITKISHRIINEIYTKKIYQDIVYARNILPKLVKVRLLFQKNFIDISIVDNQYI